MDDITLSANDSFTAMTQVIPQFKNAPQYTLSSDNSSVASVDGKTINAVANGNATVHMTTNDGAFSDSFDVTVKDLTYSGLSSTRTATGITFARIPTSIEVGEEFACQAYVLSAVTEDHPAKYIYNDDNLVYFTSSNPTVATVKNGVIFGRSTGNVTITAHDISNTVSKSFNMTVIPVETLQYTPQEVYNVTSIDTTDEESTTTGIIAELVYASENHYKKVVFPNDVYNVSPAFGTIDIPTNMIVDFNNSIIQIVESAMTQTGYGMFRFNNTEFSKIINAIIYGERYLIDGTGTEGCESIRFQGYNYKSGVEDCVISNSPGFNIHVSDAKRKVVGGMSINNIEAGGLDASGNPVSEPYSFRTINYISISALGDEIGLGNMQGYQGYIYMTARVYDICFYDSNKQFISKIENCLQYYRYPKPSNAMYVKIAYNWDTAPTTSDPDYHVIAHLYSMDAQNKCFIRRCTIENCYSTGIVPNMGDGFVIEDCLFRDNGLRDPASQIDWEDGRNRIKGHIVRNNKFVRGGPVTLVGGDGIVIHNNVFDDCYIDHRSEVQNTRIWLNQFKGSRTTTLSPKTDMVFSQNVGTNGAKYSVTSTTGFAVRMTENDFDGNS